MESELFSRRRALQLLTGAALAPLVPGCARTPSNGTSGSSKILTVQLTMGSAIPQTTQLSVNYYYFTVLNLTDNQSDPGPLPAIADPYPLNGFASNSQTSDHLGDSPPQTFVGFVLYCPPVTNTVSGYQLYTVPPDTSRPSGLFDINKLGLSGFLPKGDPDVAPSLTTGATQLYFRLRLDRLPTYTRKDTNGNTLPPPQYLQINFIQMNALPVQQSAGDQHWDALGYGPQSSALSPYLTVDLTQNGIYQNSNYSGTSAPHEESGDVYNHTSGPVSDPPLDLTDWTVQITST